MVYFRKAVILSLNGHQLQSRHVIHTGVYLVTACPSREGALSGLQGPGSPRHRAGERRSNAEDVGGPFKALDVPCKFRVDKSSSLVVTC